MPELVGERVVLRPVAQADVETLRAIRRTPEVMRWWQAIPADWPFGPEDEETLLTVLVDGEIAGLIQFLEEDEPDYRHAAVDIFLAPAQHGRGLGADAITTLVRHLVAERDHHRLIIDPAADNKAAVRCYAKAGFRPVGILHASWYDHTEGGWRDALLMELVTDGWRDTLVVSG